MRVLIIEDERPAAAKLHKALLKADAGIMVLAVLTSVRSSIQWLNQNEPPQLIFLDIELTDGLSFNIFQEAPVSCPVIFVTAYDEYWQEAFEYNSIDYLLKPIKQDKLQTALNKYEKLKSHFALNYPQLLQWQQSLPDQGRKKRFLVKRGDDYLAVKTEDIAYFYATHKLVCLVENKGQKFILDRSLSDLENEVDPAQFYRLNRKYLVNINAIRRIKAYPKSKLVIDVEPAVSEEIIISQEQVSSFKEWMGK